MRNAGDCADISRTQRFSVEWLGINYVGSLWRFVRRIEDWHLSAVSVYVYCISFVAINSMSIDLNIIWWVNGVVIFNVDRLLWSMRHGFAQTICLAFQSKQKHVSGSLWCLRSNMMCTCVYMA